MNAFLHDLLPSLLWVCLLSAMFAKVKIAI